MLRKAYSLLGWSATSHGFATLRGYFHAEIGRLIHVHPVESVAYNGGGDEIMIKRLKAIFDGKVLRPIEPLDLAPDTEVQLTLDIPESQASTGASFLDIAENLQLDGPADWSTNVDHYLYGTPDGTEQ